MDGPQPAGQAPPSPNAGWFPDPNGQPVQRYWDGAVWTTHIHDGTKVIDESSPVVWLGRLGAERQIIFRERSSETVGGRIDLLTEDGRSLGWSQAAPGQASSSTGSSAPEVWCGLFAANGVLLGSLRRPPSRQPGSHTHLVVDPGGAPVGWFNDGGLRGDAVGLFTSQGRFGVANFTVAESWILDAEKRPLAHIRRSSPGAKINLFLPVGGTLDSFTLEPMAPLPPWIFLLLLFAPIEMNIRLDARRATNRRRNAGNNF